MSIQFWTNGISQRKKNCAINWHNKIIVWVVIFLRKSKEKKSYICILARTKKKDSKSEWERSCFINNFSSVCLCVQFSKKKPQQEISGEFIMFIVYLYICEWSAFLFIFAQNETNKKKRKIEIRRLSLSLVGVSVRGDVIVFKCARASKQ